MNNSNPQNLENSTESLMSESLLQTRQLPSWRLLLPLFFQFALIVSVPAQAVYTYVTGETVVLQTAPVDPYDFLRGYYQVLGYDISTSETLKPLPGWKELSNNQDYLAPGTTVYVVLEKPTTPTESQRPQAWKPIAVSSSLPENLPPNQIALQGESNGWQILYGLETYYMPEDQRVQVNQNITDAQQKNPESFVVEVKVNTQGKAVPVSLWVREQNYRF
ncbi:GDYXXLXY domain-containing protein [Limnoraphis robusta Tam1]|uniref:GDYXXLXY domain-containing protein n=1 Tax=Limnoraphis robusta TaxID=1118279 RepID=UPI002B20FC57|nr:GDYXXLXY domain-containing protein [Limnoraphis robusta]MEA5542529.1 GDYXXLXY domain-containing protein [Limnoraphis robusta Tam1]